jgi:hypothetical protein
VFSSTTNSAPARVSDQPYRRAWVEPSRPSHRGHFELTSRQQPLPAARSPSSSVWHGCKSLLTAIANAARDLRRQGGEECPKYRTTVNSRPALRGAFPTVALYCGSISWSPSVGIEFIRHIHAVNLGTNGSTSACWSSLSGLTSTNEAVPQSLPSEKGKVAGSIPGPASCIHTCRHIHSRLPGMWRMLHLVPGGSFRFGFDVSVAVIRSSPNTSLPGRQSPGSCVTRPCAVRTAAPLAQRVFCRCGETWTGNS